MAIENIHLAYISNVLIKEIADKLLPEKLLDFTAKHLSGLDGFMSALYSLDLRTKDENNKESSRQLIAKFMKGDEVFRVSSRSYIQFANEIFIYAQVIPYYSEVLANVGVQSVKTDDWIAKVYVAKFGKIDELADVEGKTSNESVLVLENLKPKGYKLGPPHYLNREYMLAMMKPLAEYHAMSYALRLRKDPHFQKLVDGVIPLPFIENENTTNNFYDVLYRLAFDRFFEYFERCKDTLISKDNPEDVILGKSIMKLKEKYFKSPTELLEYIRIVRDEDQQFAAILHGDFNRNNVLFRFENDDDVPKDARLIDFQELRYGTPCIDLSFAMYMNMDHSIRETFWNELLIHYHSNLYNTMEAVVKDCNEETLTALKSYSFQNFNKHFTKYAFYGVMVCMHFLPWLCGTEEDLKTLSYWFETDMHGKEFRKISIEVGGDDANQRLFEIIKHAHKMGYMEAI